MKTTLFHLLDEADTEARQFYFTLQVARPLTEADLEKTPC